MLENKKFEMDLAGRKLKVTFSPLAEQANGSCLVQYGDSLILATATMGKSDRDGDFFPLTVEYEEKFYAAGKILGSRFVRREGKASEPAILSGRLIDRTIRPLFDQRLRRDVQVVVTVLSIDEDNDPDFIGLIGASLALSCSDIPWAGPISGIRIGQKDGQFIINPTYKQRAESFFDAFVSSIGDKINMLEIGANENPESEVLAAIKLAQETIMGINDFQKQIIAVMGKPKANVMLMEIDPEFKKQVQEFLAPKLEDAIYQKNKMEMSRKIDELTNELKEWAKNIGEDKVNIALTILENEIDATVHKNILAKEQRPDGRKLDELRQLFAQAGNILPRVHGCGLFIRGNTQALSSVTLAGPAKELTIETIESSESKRFIHHYNFPSFSVGEAKSSRGPGRREIGHGALAEKALRPMIPTKDQFPYTIRVVSEILSSNGSSSMASACGSSLALMDAGVPIKGPVAGIAMGLMMDDKGYKVLTDIQGPEDHYGDMDFKVAGTKDGVNACQMDVKIDGISLEIVEKTLAQAKKARLEILAVINGALSAPRANLSPLAPKIKIIKIKPEQIGLVIGSGGKTIKEIMERTGVEIDIDDDGSVFITGVDAAKVDEAAKTIESITHEFTAGEIAEGKIVKILDFGAVIEFGPNSDALLHISELAHRRVEKVEDVVKLGDIIKVKILRVEPDGKIGVSLKALTPAPENNGAYGMVDDYQRPAYRPERRPMSRDRGPRRPRGKF
ncbi:MAG TPA: polyribonucleotide nucleotidyltransferase [Candidatus Paceibacterota bacterium]|nr:polyribonucleotide nucleotidyltransferase [Candidatus Paceibacterota bacterium]